MAVQAEVEGHGRSEQRLTGFAAVQAGAGRLVAASLHISGHVADLRRRQLGPPTQVPPSSWGWGLGVGDVVMGLLADELEDGTPSLIFGPGVGRRAFVGSVERDGWGRSAGILADEGSSTASRRWMSESESGRSRGPPSRYRLQRITHDIRPYRLSTLTRHAPCRLYSVPASVSARPCTCRAEELLRCLTLFLSLPLPSRVAGAAPDAFESDRLGDYVRGAQAELSIGGLGRRASWVVEEGRGDPAHGRRQHGGTKNV